MQCTKCFKKNFRKNGKRKDGEQRYLCRECGRTFSKHKEKTSYSPIEQRLLSMLINFLENDLSNLSIKDHLNDSKRYNSDIENIKFIPYKETKPYDYRTEYEVKCKYPRLLICGNKNEIKLIKIPRGITKNCKKHFYFTVD